MYTIRPRSLLSASMPPLRWNKSFAFASYSPRAPNWKKSPVEVENIPVVPPVGIHAKECVSAKDVHNIRADIHQATFPLLIQCYVIFPLLIQCYVDFALLIHCYVDFTLLIQCYVDFTPLIQCCVVFPLLI